MKLPASICGYALSNPAYLEPLRLFCYLKMLTTTGRLVTPPLTRTQQKHLQTLIGWRWSAEKNGVLFLRKFTTIARYYKLRVKRGKKIMPDHVRNRQTFAAMLTAIVIQEINRKRGRRKGAPAARSGSSKPTRVLQLPQINYSNACAVRYLANYLKISVGKAHRLKQLALDHKFIKVQARRREFEFYADGKLISPVAQQLPAVLQDYPQLRGRIFLRSGIPFYRQPDQITTII
jgi:hypothetical protein